MRAPARPAAPSLAVGVGHIRAATAQPSLFGFFRPSPLQVSAISFATFVAFGVGHDPDSVAAVRGTNGRSRYAMPFRIKPERGQVSENSAKSPSKQSCDVFHDDV